MKIPINLKTTDRDHNLILLFKDINVNGNAMPQFNDYVRL
jgi:hypothetical protein